jgi:pimeloyl-ACP methyl ester carboxylesterase
VDVPETRYAKTADGVSIAYQLFGTGADLLFVPGYISNLELNWDLPAYADLLHRLASFSRVIAVDRRGTGLSDRLSPRDQPPLEILMEDLGCVLDEAGSERATIVGLLDGGYLCMLFAATHPDRTRALVVYGTSASGKWSPDYPWQWKPDRWESYFDEMASGWGKQQFAYDGLAWYAPSALQDEATRRWWERYQRLAASPGSAIALERLYSQTDVRHVLPSIRVPTLVLHRRGDPVEPVEGARYIAREIKGAKYVELNGVDAPQWAGDWKSIIDEIEEFVTGVRRAPEADRVLSTVLFTDIVGSTEHLARIGDGPWKDLRGAIRRAGEGRDPAGTRDLRGLRRGRCLRNVRRTRARGPVRDGDRRRDTDSGDRDSRGVPHGRDRACRRRRARYRRPYRSQDRGDGRAL